MNMKTAYPFRLAALTLAALAALALAAVLAAPADGAPAAPPNFNTTASMQTPQPLPGNHDERPVVAIYELRSGVPEVGARATTDLFVTALVHSSQFRVVERARINEG